MLESSPNKNKKKKNSLRNIDDIFLILTYARPSFDTLIAHADDFHKIHFFHLGPSASQSFEGGASAAFRILVDSSLHCCLFWAMHLRCSRSSLVVSCNVFSCSLDRSLLRTTGSVVKGRPRNFFPCVAIIKFSCEIFSSKISFLDVLVTLHDGKLDTDLYLKHADTFNYLQ